MQRRLQSLRMDGYATQCHALYVGAKLVYRVTIQTAIAPNATWVAGVSKAKLEAFRVQLARLVEAMHTDPTEPWSADGHIERLLEHVLDIATKLHATTFAASTDDDRDLVERFVFEVLSAYTLLTSLEVADVSASALANQVLHFYVILREFLMIPDDVTSARNRLAIAVMNLTDIEPPTALGGGCSICLEPWQHANVPALATVQLPCGHVYHEECVIEWIRQNANCPVCRAVIGPVP
ncbi:hypothetical protein SDRG_03457 [Saprolegnia diclina VS20]|uniref:RING-type domain-containing protein n=1 Tax=Saprolegnia diclina (strain VS20) TaxID=1156394 RepID=T0S984_SAPDV|nr:hypothetical protein SDRG_03457 [Saprolegnia diclina VS20]EQC39252.1 hypothetical protein SDRG_03457 [Saprolegnia diclina VS20]|eukprot:XP_008607313.1 hypothetical protein SDRG_03457 [Saprolegnia diclina VS20]